MTKDITQQIKDHLAVEGMVPNKVTRQILLNAGKIIEELRKKPKPLKWGRDEVRKQD